MAAETVWPASMWQRHVLESEKRRPGTGAGVYFSVNAVVELDGPLRTEALQRAYGRLLRRHDLLRTRLVVDEGPEPFQAVRAEGAGSVDILDEDEVAAAEGWVHAPIAQERSPIRIRLAHRGPAQHVLSLHLHHLVSDPATLWGVLRELAGLYTAELGGPAPPPPRAHYRDYACEELRQSRSCRGAAEHWWESTVGGARFAAVRPGPAGAPFAYRDEILTADLLTRAHRLARSCRGTLYVVLLAALACAMEPYLGDGDHLVFLTVFGRRDRPEWQDMPGPCMVPAYVPVPRPVAGLSEKYVHTVRDHVLGCRRHALLPTSEVARMNPFFADTGNIVPFFEYLPLARPERLAFGGATGRVVDAAGTRDTGLARYLGIRARPTAGGALTAHFSANGTGWTAPLTKAVCQTLAERIASATPAEQPGAAAIGAH